MQQMILDQLGTLRAEQRSGFTDLRSEINLRLDRLVTNEAFAAEQKRVDERNASLGREMGDERTAREKAVQALEARLDKSATNIRWLAASIIVPVGLFVGNIVLIRGGV